MKGEFRFALAAAGIFLVLVGVFGLSHYQRQTTASSVPLPSDFRTIELHGQTIRVSVAETESAREQGLSGRSGLAADEGMLFVFPQDGEYAFWMKDMLFSIDILWLSASGSVVYMAQNVSPDTYPQNFGSNALARYVLELPAGYAKAYNVSIGDIVRL